MNLPTTLEIIEVGRSGDGLAQIGSQRFHVPFTLPGEIVEAQVSGDRGSIVQLVRASSERIEPFCQYFGLCGGCQLQHWRPEQYHSWKAGLVRQALERAGLETEIAPVIDAHGTGRRRVTLRSRQGGAGFNVARTHRVLDIKACPILVPELQPAFDIARALYPLAGDCDVSVTQSDTGLDVAVKAHRSTSAVNLVSVATRFDLARLSLNGEALATLRPAELHIGKAHVRLPIGGFLQATAEAELAMADIVVSACKGARNVADLFCGIGPFALRLAETSKVFAADSDQGALDALAQAGRMAQGLKSVRVENRNLFENPLTPAELGEFDALVFDPPRAGAEAQARKISRSKVPKVVGISCDAGTFARDAAILVAGGYRLKKVVPIDQFAWSSHIELVGLFER